MTTATEYVELKRKIELYEGNIEHMYLDSNGFVTVGVGHVIPNASRAAKLTFYVTKTAWWQRKNRRRQNTTRC